MRRLVAALTWTLAVGCTNGADAPPSESITGPGGNASDSAAPVTPSAGGSGDPIFSLDDSGARAGTTRDAGRAIDPTPTQITRHECPGAVDVVTAQALAAPSVPGTLQFLYPYDKTVFPAGLLSPTLQWTPGSTAGAAAGIPVRLVMKSSFFEYEGCLVAFEAGRVQVPADVWETAVRQSQGVGDPLSVKLSTFEGGIAYGPVEQTWTIALGSLKGTVYYNTYNSPIANRNGAVMKIDPGAAEPTAYLTVQNGEIGCISCHSVSANGTIMVAGHHESGLGPSGAISVDVTTSSTNPPRLSTSLGEAAFAAMYPDGSRAVRMGSPGAGGPFGAGNVTGMWGVTESNLFDPKTGAAIAAPGWDGVIQFAKMPSFSPSGKKIAFNHHTDSNGHSLAVMDFDAATNTFSNLQIVYSHPTLYPGWPVFTPDEKMIVFALGDQASYGSYTSTASSGLYAVDLATKTPVSLDRVNGLENGAPYVPKPDQDLYRNFYPTMSPIAAGGYAWLYFTSRRTYGNLWTVPFTSAESKKIWVAAIDLGTEPGTDPSHPAFYLDGQELESGNIRAFPVLEPCRPDGDSCTSGIDCCSGFCTDGICGPPTKACSELEERCEADADCCDERQTCVARFCALPVPW